MIKAYICGGFSTKNIILKDIIEFDIANQKFKIFGFLNTARYNAGVVKCHKYIWVFGGENLNGLVDSIERVPLETGGIFECITL